MSAEARLEAALEALEARLEREVLQPVTESFSTSRAALTAGSVRRHAARRAADGDALKAARARAGDAVAAMFAASSAPALIERADAALARSDRGEGSAGCLRRCSDRTFSTWGYVVLRTLCWLWSIRWERPEDEIALQAAGDSSASTGPGPSVAA